MELTGVVVTFLVTEAVAAAISLPALRVMMA